MFKPRKVGKVPNGIRPGSTMEGRPRDARMGPDALVRVAEQSSAGIRRRPSLQLASPAPAQYDRLADIDIVVFYPSAARPVSCSAAGPSSGQGSHRVPGVSRLQHHRSATPEQSRVDQGSRQNDQVGGPGRSGRSRLLHRLPEYKFSFRQTPRGNAADCVAEEALSTNYRSALSWPMAKRFSKRFGIAFNQNPIATSFAGRDHRNYSHPAGASREEGNSSSTIAVSHKRWHHVDG